MTRSVLCLLAPLLIAFPVTAAHADNVAIVNEGPYGPYPYSPHGPYFGPHRRPPPRVVVVEPAPPPVVVMQPAAPTVVTAPAAAAQVQASQPYCREFQTQTIVGGQVQPSYGIACQQPDGNWKILSQKP